VRTRVTIAAVTLVLVAGVAAAWWFESHTPAAGTPAASGAPGGYAVKVTRDGRLLASYSLAQLQAIGMRSVVVQGGTETGPQLLAVLERAGAGTFASVTIIGTGTRDAGRLVLPATDIGPDTVLDIAKRGTVKVAGPSIPREQRVRDIVEIQVR
jgi:hypothetical protein